MTIGETIREYRQRKNLTQKQLGELSNTSESTIKQYELGKRQPRIMQLKQIAQALEVNLEDLLFPSSESTTRTMHDYMDMKGKPLTEYFDAWLKVCEIEWDEVEKDGKKGRLFRFEGVKILGEDAREYFVTDTQFKKLRNSEVLFVKDKIRDYDDMNTSTDD